MALQRERIQLPGMKEAEDLVLTKSYRPNFNFPHFNPLQSRALEHALAWHDLFVIGKTASGKTVVGEMYALEAAERGVKTLYLAPMKALADEKYTEWKHSRSPLSHLQIGKITGDSRPNERSNSVLNAADIIIATPEILDVQVRRDPIHYPQWISAIGAIVVDEAHLITSKERGPRLESAIMRTTETFPECRWLLLSATAPNSREYGAWLSSLVSRHVHIVESEYRPTQLQVQASLYKINRSESREDTQRKQCLEIIRNNPEASVLIFSGYRRWAQDTAKFLQKHGIKAGYHIARRSPETLELLQRDFTERKLQVLVATTTLAWGVNLPATHVIIAHQYFHPEENPEQEIPDYDIWQMLGRSGRPQYDKVGTGHILLAEETAHYHMARIQNKAPLASKMVDQLPFHILGRIHSVDGQTKDDLLQALSRSFASYQGSFNQCQVQEALDKLEEWRFISEEVDDVGRSVYVITKRGEACAFMYLDPEDIWIMFSTLMGHAPWRKHDFVSVDIAIAWVLADRPSAYRAHAPAGLLGILSEFKHVLSTTLGMYEPNIDLGAAECALHLLMGLQPGAFSKRFPAFKPTSHSFNKMKVSDLSRICSCLHRWLVADAEVEVHDKAQAIDFLNRMTERLRDLARDSAAGLEE
ncbi:DEAD/DEAH box helicase [Nitrospira sp. Nam74]